MVAKKKVTPSMKALREAASLGDIERAAALIDAGTSVRGRVSKGGINHDSPLHLAARFGRVDMIRLLHTRGAYLNCHDLKGERPLHKAVEAGHKECVEVLVELGADVRAPDFEGLTPLHSAASAALCKDEVLSLLIRAGALVDEVADNAEADKRYTPLALAIRSGHKGTANALLKLGADPKRVYGRRKLPIHAAAELGSVGMLELLDGKGGDWSTLDGDGCSPFELAAKSEKGAPALRWLIKKGVVDGELEKTAEAAARLGRAESLAVLLDEYGSHLPLGVMLSNLICDNQSQVGVFRRLLDLGGLSEIDDPVAKARVTYSIATCRCDQNLDLIKTAIRHGLDVNLPYYHVHPLVFSAAVYNFDLVEVLLENGADPDRIGPDGWGATPEKATDHARAMIDAFKAKKAVMNAISRRAASTLP
jgi:ankyrin repeat protein